MRRCYRRWCSSSQLVRRRNYKCRRRFQYRCCRYPPLLFVIVQPLSCIVEAAFVTALRALLQMPPPCSLVWLPVMVLLVITTPAVLPI